MLLIISLFGALSAKAAPLESAEFYNTAHTLSKGTRVIHPLYPSMFGVSDRVDIKTSFFGWIAGPNVTTEVGLMSNDDMALSVDIVTNALWVGVATAGATVNFTSGGPLSNRFNASLGGIQTLGYGLSLPVLVGYDMVTADDTTIKFEGTTDIALITAGGPSGSLGASWNKGWDAFRLRLGLTAYYMSLDEETADALELLDVSAPAFLPLPSVQLWWFK